jgi:hypothetical protein
VIHEALMRPGSVWRAPEGAEGLTLRAGNAGGVFVEIDGALFGPLGGAGGVVSGVDLDPASLAERLPSAEATDALVEAAVAASLVEGGAARP